MAEVDIGSSSSPFTDALQRITTELAHRGYDIRASIPETLLRAHVGGQTHNFVTGLTARSPDGHAVWTVRFDWDPEKQSHVNGSWLVHAGAQPRKGEEGEKFFSRFRFSDTNGYYQGTEMLQGDAGNGDLSWLWRGWKARYFEVNPVSGRSDPIVCVPKGTRR
jgi:hypothetical protein